MNQYIISLFEEENLVSKINFQDQFINDYTDFCDHCDYCDCDAEW